MIIQDPDAFKTWLTSVLKPMCEADPSALAKYVIALVKKDKSSEALRDSMISQLEVFLQAETVSFVDLLFKTLDNQDYLDSVIPNANPPNPNVLNPPPKPDPLPPSIPAAPTTLSPIKPKDIIKPIIPVSELPTLIEKKELREEEAVIVPKSLPPPRRRSRHRSLSRGRSRSRSWDRTRRSRSKEKVPKRGERGRPWRNKSPPRSRYDRRRSRSGSAGGGGGRALRSRSRSPRYQHRGRYRNRSPPRSASRSRSRSKDRKDATGKVLVEAKEPRSGAATPTQDSNHGDMDLRLGTQSIQSVVPAAAGPKRRCRDYDEKGYCMRGEMCPFDHGMDPVVLEDSTLSRVLTYAPNGGPVPPDVVVGGNLLPPGIPPMMHGLAPRPPVLPEYNPQAPQIFHRGFRGPRPPPILGPRIPPMNPFPQQQQQQNVPNVPNVQQRELIPIPVLDTQGSMLPDGPFKGFHHASIVEQQQQQQQHQQQLPPDLFKKRGFDFGRLGPRQKNPANCSLELKKVPPGLNNIAHLNNHFSKFGKILNIQVGYENDPEAAIVTFSSHAEANAAYRSTEAVLNNRFIKVFWHSNNNNDGKQENAPPRSVKERLGIPQIVAPNSNKVLNLVQPKGGAVGVAAAAGDPSTKQADAPQPASQPPRRRSEDEAAAAAASSAAAKSQRTAEAIKEERRAQATAAIKKNQELLATKEKLKKNQEEKRKEALKVSQDLRKRQQELLKKQLEQQKLLIGKLEKTPAGPHRDQLMETIKKSQEAIEGIRKAILTMSVPSTTAPAKGTAATAAAATGALPPAKKSKEEAQKEMLDAELDLITKQQEGADTSEIQKRILELRARAHATRGGGGGRPVRGRRFAPPVSRHLLSKNNLVDASTKKMNRFKKLSVDHRPSKILVSGYESDEQKSVLSQLSIAQEISEEALLQDDEEEDEENEDRSWRR